MTEEEVKKLNDGRVLRMAAPALLPLIRKKKDAALSKLITQYRGGETNLLPAAAELTAYHDIETEITRKNKETENIERKLHGN